MTTMDRTSAKRSSRHGIPEVRAAFEPLGIDRWVGTSFHLTGDVLVNESV